MTRSKSSTRAFILAILLLAAAAVGAACKKHSTGSAAPSRTYRMGFQSSAPKPDFNLFIQSLNIWTNHSDATIISTEIPWNSLLNGENPVTYIVDNYLTLANVCRTKNMKIWVYIDPANGLDRRIDANSLVARGKSIAQTDIQQIYQRFVVVADSILHPDHLGLALETNLIRFASPDSIYQGVRKAVNAAAAQVRIIDPHVPLSVSVQAEVAWGVLNNAGTPAFVGVSKDFTDFPFIQELGISSYPYLSFHNPADIPQNYYSQLVAGHNTPVFVSEGGWTSMNLNAFSIQSSPAQQQNYIRRQALLLSQAKAIALFQLTFTDLALSGWPAVDSAGLIPFAFLGMVDSNFVSKPAFATWDSLRKLPIL